MQHLKGFGLGTFLKFSLFKFGYTVSLDRLCECWPGSVVFILWLGMEQLMATLGTYIDTFQISKGWNAPFYAFRWVCNNTKKYRWQVGFLCGVPQKKHCIIILYHARENFVRGKKLECIKYDANTLSTDPLLGGLAKVITEMEQSTRASEIFARYQTHVFLGNYTLA